MELDPLDTLAESRRTQEASHSALGPEGRLRAALEMSEAVRQIRFAGLRAQHPDASGPELTRKFIAEAHRVSLERLT